MEIFLFFLGAIGLTGGSKLIHKYVLKEISPYSYSLFMNGVGAFVFLALASRSMHFPTDRNAWVILTVASLLWVCSSVINFISYKNEELSLREPLYQIKILFTLLLGVVFLGESFSFFKVFSTLLLFVGLFILLYSKEKKWENFVRRGVLWTIAAAFLTGGVTVLDKYSLGYFNVETYGFLVFLIPFFLLSSALIRPQLRKDFSYLLKNKWRSALLGTVLSTLGYYFILKVFQNTDLTLAYPILQLSTLIGVLGGIIIFKERENVPRKIIGTIIIVLAAILLKLG